jgi:NADH-quinone oxidoreductase subunit C
MRSGDASSRPLPFSLQALDEAVAAHLGGRISERSEAFGELTYEVAPKDWKEVLRFLKDAPEAAFDQLDCLLGDHLPERKDRPFAVVVHLVSHTHGHRLRVKTALAEGEELATVTDLWPSAGFDEREAWEMFGIPFAGHPDLRRLLTTEDFEGFPLRKDFPLQGTVGGRIRTDLRGKI